MRELSILKFLFNTWGYFFFSSLIFSLEKKYGQCKKYGHQIYFVSICITIPHVSVQFTYQLSVFFFFHACFSLLYHLETVRFQAVKRLNTNMISQRGAIIISLLPHNMPLYFAGSHILDTECVRKCVHGTRRVPEWFVRFVRFYWLYRPPLGVWEYKHIYNIVSI